MAAIDIEKLRAYAIPDTRDDYDSRDAILYALGVGAGLSEHDETHLVYERDLVVLPTMALVLGWPGYWPMDPASGLPWQHILHGEQRFVLHRPLPVSGHVAGHNTIDGFADKGAGRPAILKIGHRLVSPGGEDIATSTALWVVPGAGGFGGASTLDVEPLNPVPQRDADARIALPTSPAQAMIYRLSGDRNPLHIDPVLARESGYEKPILHGLSTMGMAARAIAIALLAGDPALVRGMAQRFTAPVFPGETLEFELWREGGAIAYRASVRQRGTIVVDSGLAQLWDEGQ